METTTKTPKETKAFILRHKEPFYFYINKQKSGTGFINYKQDNGRGSIRLLLQRKVRGKWKETEEQYMAIIPKPLFCRFAKKIEEYGSFNHRQKITFEKMKLVRYAVAKK